MKLTISMLGIAVVTATVVGCGGGSAESPSDTIEDLISSLCERAHACRDSYIPAMNGGLPFEDAFSSRVDNCVTQRQSLLIALFGVDYFEKVDASAEAGRINYSSAKAEACLAAIRNQTCDQVFEQNGQSVDDSVCDMVVVGTVPTGGACTIEDDCATPGDDCLSTKVCG